MLARNGFVVVPGSAPSFADLYAAPYASAEAIAWPVYISADSILHVSKLALDRVQRVVGHEYLSPELELLDKEMYALSWAQYERVAGTTSAAAQRVAATALRNAGYFAVGASLLDPEFSVPEVLTPVVEAELALIAAGEAITVSPLLDLPGVPDEEKQRVDYRLFALPADNALDEVQARYHRAMTWHRQVAFRPEQREETRSAVLIAHTLQAHSAPRVLWERLCAALTFFHGRDASYTVLQYADLAAQVWEDPSLSGSLTALADEERMDAFVAGIRDLSLPENSIWTIWAAKQPLQREWHLFGYPFRTEEYVLSQTTAPYVGSSGNERTLPSGIDLAAVLGSLEAYRVADEVGFTEFVNYLEQVDEVRNELSAVPTAHWAKEQHWNWLHVYRRLLQEKNASYPAWMNTTAWKRHTLQTQLGAWTHVLYRAEFDLQAIPSVEEDAVAPSGAPVPGAWGYVEPQPEVYARLAALIRLAIDGLENRLMLPNDEREVLLELEGWLIFLQEAARRELIVPSLGEDEYRRMGEWGSFVNQITEASRVGLVGAEGPALGAAASEAVAVPIAVAGGEQLIEATGPVDEIYVAVERGRQVFLARGGVYAQYEFTWPAGEPMTSARWRERLARGQAPDRPLWVQGIVIEE
jgi:hypothetical protein